MKPMSTVKIKQGSTNMDIAEVPKCTEEHFSAHPTMAFPHQPTTIDIPGLPNEAARLCPFKKIGQVVIEMMNWRALDIGSIIVEVLRANTSSKSNISNKASKYVIYFHKL